jgi:hypothetical protein
VYRHKHFSLQLALRCPPAECPTSSGIVGPVFSRAKLYRRSIAAPPNPPYTPTFQAHGVLHLHPAPLLPVRLSTKAACKTRTRLRSPQTEAALRVPAPKIPTDIAAMVTGRITATSLPAINCRQSRFSLTLALNFRKKAHVQCVSNGAYHRKQLFKLPQLHFAHCL